MLVCLCSSVSRTSAEWMKTGHGALPRPEPSGGVLAYIWQLTLVVG